MASTLSPSWQDDPTTWDRLKIGAFWLPGPVTVKIRDASLGLSVRKAPKTNRAALVDQGQNPVSATIEMTIGFVPVAGSPWKSPAEQFSDWQRIHEEIWAKRPKTRTALRVSHPEFAMKGVGKVFVTDVSGLAGEGPGVRTVTIDVIQQAPIVPVSAGTVAGVSGRAAPPIASTLGRAPNPAVSETGP